MIISDGRKIKVYNVSQDTLLPNKVVIVKGKNAYYASNTDADCQKYPLGLTLQSIPTASYGEILLEGTASNITTDIYGNSGNTLLYLGTNGTIISTAPTTSSEIYIIGNVIIIDNVNGQIYFKVIIPSSGGGSGEWGQITGDISTQNDLINLLNNKFDDPTGTTSQYIRGDGSLATFPSIPTVTPAALTKTDDTNVTLALGGSPTNALLQAVSLTLGWTGTLADSRIASASTWTAKQDALVSGTNIKTINNNSILGSGNLTVSGVPVGGNAGDILAKNSATDYDAGWIENYTSSVKHIVKLAESINKGQAVYVSSADGTNIKVSKASNASEATSSKTMGLLAFTGATNDIGFVVTEGLLAGLDTSTAGNAGDPVWLGTNGDLIYGLANKPSAPQHLVFIGIVTRKQSQNGEIFVKVQNGFEIEELHNVSAKTPNGGDTLIFNKDTNLWESKAVVVPAGMTWMGAFPG